MAEAESEVNLNNTEKCYPESYFLERPFEIVRFPFRKQAVLPYEEVIISKIKIEQDLDSGSDCSDYEELPGPPLKNQNSNLEEYLQQKRPIDLSQLMDEQQLDLELDDMQGKIKELLKLTWPGGVPGPSDLIDEVFFAEEKKNLDEDEEDDYGEPNRITPPGLPMPLTMQGTGVEIDEEQDEEIFDEESQYNVQKYMEQSY